MVNTGKELHKKIMWFFNNNDADVMTKDEYKMIRESRIVNNEIIMPIRTKFKDISKIMQELDKIAEPEREKAPDTI